MRLASLALVVIATATLGARAGDVAPAGPAKPAASPPTKTIADAWAAMPETGSACASDDLAFDYGRDGGMRNTFCRALQVLPWRTFLSLAPAKPFLKGPHKGGQLDLHDERDFGRYDPAFVRWATRALVPGADDEALVRSTRQVYERQLKTLARLYFLVDKALEADPAWVERERRRYLSLMDELGGSWDVWVITDPYHDVLGSADVDWGGHDPNHVRAATMWWLRRAHDGTRPLWSDGLQRLLKTYDELWLRDQLEVKAHALPKTEKAAPPPTDYKAPTEEDDDEEPVGVEANPPPTKTTPKKPNKVKPAPKGKR